MSHKLYSPLHEWNTIITTEKLYHVNLISHIANRFIHLLTIVTYISQTMNDV